MMRTVIIGMVLLWLSGSGASAVTSTAADEPLDGGLADEARSAAPTAPPVPPPAAAVPGPVASPSATPAPERTLSANPLWAVPVSQLSGTRDRPVFSSSRRPVPAAVVAEPVAAKPPPPPKKREPDRPPVALVGTIASGEEGFGIFLDSSTKATLRLKLGDDYQGWKLRAIQGREVTLEKDQQIAIVGMPQPGTASVAGEVRLQPATAFKPPPVTPVKPPPATWRRPLVNPVAERTR